MKTNLAKLVSTIHQQVRNCPKSQQFECKYCAGGLMIDPTAQKILVVKGPSKWSLPKGHAVVGEYSYETAAREILEETSLKLHLTEKHYHRRICKEIYYYIIIDRGAHLSLTPIDRHEVSKVCWCSKDDLLKLNCNKTLKNCLLHWDTIIQFFNKYRQQLSIKYCLPPPENWRTLHLAN